MTATRRHPTEELILDLARGALEEGRSLVLRAHVWACPDCAAALALAEAVGGALIDGLEPAHLAPDALAQAMARIDSPPPVRAGAAAPQPADWIAVPPQVRAAARKRRWTAPRVWVADVTGARGAGPRSYLLRIGAGVAVPRHTHRGREMICVLKGAFEADGIVYGPGDFSDSDETVEHRPQVTAESECVCLVAADNRLVPRDLIGRLFQPFVGI